MTAFYLICFVGGLLLAVRVMLLGVEREAKSSSLTRRRVRFWLPPFVAFATIFGVSGYLLSRSPAVLPLSFSSSSYNPHLRGGGKSGCAK